MNNKGGFSWKKLMGLSAAKSSLSRKIKIPLTKGGRQRKTGAGSLLALLFTLFFD
jgi:hypothetical protein